MAGPDEWLSPARVQKPAYNPANILFMLETDRLILRDWRAEDLAPFAVMNADPAVMEFFPSCLDRTESDALARRISEALAKRGWGLFAVELKSQPGGFIGFTGASVPGFEAPFTPCVEIGWRLSPDVWGQGIAAEAARAVLPVAFSKLALSEVVSFTSARNIRSRRVMEKIGMTHKQDDDFDHPHLPEGHPLRRHVLYRLQRPPLLR
jgi:RimJ/RimL family protein N-acetyltransferase